jgi:integrase
MLSPRLLEVLRCWWRSQHPSRQPRNTSPEDWLFPGFRQGRHMNTESLQTACREAARAAGLSKRVTVHTLRHYAGFRTMPSKLSAPLPFRLFPKTRLGIVCAGSSHGCWSNGNSVRLLL